MAYTELYVRSDADGAGDGTTDANSGANGSFTWAQMLLNATAGPCRYNIKAGTYANTTATNAFTTPGTAALPRSLRGFNATIGDLEANGRTAGGALVTTNFPAITYTTGGVTFGAFFVVEHLQITAARAGATVTPGTNNVIRRCDLLNNHATSPAAQAIQTGTTYTLLIDTDINCTAANAAASALGLDRGKARNCLIKCASGIAVSMGTFSDIQGCMIRDSVTGITYNSLVGGIDSCSFRNISGNYINNAAANPGLSIQNCVAWGSGGSSKWYNSTTSVRQHAQFNNAVGNMGAADTNEGDWPVYNEVALTADPFTSSTDLTLNSTAGGGAACKGVGLFPYLDLGAIQVQASASGGGGQRVIGG